MGNRAWLYLQTEQDSDTPAIEVASVKNCLPTLWQILLATSETTRANTTQRVFGDAGTEGLCAPAQAALARLTQLAAFLTERADDPGATYCRQLQGRCCGSASCSRAILTARHACSTPTSTRSPGW